jgi:hypothetical protein
MRRPAEHGETDLAEVRRHLIGVDRGEECAPEGVGGQDGTAAEHLAPAVPGPSRSAPVPGVIAMELFNAAQDAVGGLIAPALPRGRPPSARA